MFAVVLCWLVFMESVCLIFSLHERVCGHLSVRFHLSLFLFDDVEFYVGLYRLTVYSSIYSCVHFNLI